MTKRRFQSAQKMSHKLLIKKEHIAS